MTEDQARLNADSLSRTLRVGRQVTAFTDALFEPRASDRSNPFEDPTKTGLFRDHRCWKCNDGEKTCCQGTPNQCEYPRARND